MRWPRLRPSPARGALSAALALVLLAAGAREAAAQSCQTNGATTCTFSVPVTINVGTAVAATLASSTATLATPTAGDFDAGSSVTAAPTLTVQANRSWTLLVAAGAAAWTTSGGSPGDPPWAAKPIADLQWGTSATGPTWTALSQTAATVTTGAGATPNAGQAVAVYFKLLHAWTTDTPGTYSLPVTYTLTAP